MRSLFDAANPICRCGPSSRGQEACAQRSRGTRAFPPVPTIVWAPRSPLLFIRGWRVSEVLGPGADDLDRAVGDLDLDAKPPPWSEPLSTSTASRRCSARPRPRAPKVSTCWHRSWSSCFVDDSQLGPKNPARRRRVAGTTSTSDSSSTSSPRQRRATCCCSSPSPKRSCRPRPRAVSTQGFGMLPAVDGDHRALRRGRSRPRRHRATSGTRARQPSFASAARSPPGEDVKAASHPP